MRTALVVLLGLAACAAASPFGSRRHLAGGPTCFSCDTECAACTSKVAFTDTDGVSKLRVTINVGGCKNEPLSWMCCRGAGGDNTEPTALDCTLADNSPCGGVVEADKNKCNTVTSSIYIVPSTATTLTVQIHDGRQAGNIDCSGGNCCAGEGGQGSGCPNAANGVCNRIINLASCPTGPPVGGGGCTTDAQCASFPVPDCATPKCNTGTGACYAAPRGAGYVCRPAAAGDLCDVAEVCDGTSLTCPTDQVADTSVVCRPANGLCDVAENCDGTTKACPTDAVAAKGTTCRAATGLCDVAEECDGTTKACPTDAVAAKGTTCRAATGLCDVAEECDGSDKACPTDAVAAKGTTCRAATGLCDVAEECDGSDKACPTDAVAAKGTVCRQSAGVCDAEEQCDGQIKTCPDDAKKPATEVCRPAKDKCDLDEKCTGTSNACPDDQVYRDKAKGFKCGRDCFFCGAKSQAELEKLRNTWALGSCNMGACDNFIWLDEKDPYCTGPVSLTCPNGKGLSNIEHAVCDPNTGRFNCVLKQDGSFTGPVSPPW